MKKIFKKIQLKGLLIGIISGVIIGGGIFGTLGIVATTNKLEAKYVMYTKDGETMTVQDAIKDLYVLANNKGGSTETLPLGTPDVVSYTVTVPYTGEYDQIRCIYGTDENYGNEGTISENKCTFSGTTTNQTLYYKLIASNITNGNSGKIYEDSGSTVTANTKPLSIVNVGDYIYMEPTTKSYSITSSMTGCTSGAQNTNGSATCGGINGASQTINPSELTVWRVIRKNSDGTVDVVSENVSSTNVYFYGQTGYQKFIGTLNAIAAQYTSNYVERTRHMGYDGTATQNITTTSKLTTTSKPFSSTSSSTTSANEALGAGDMGYETDYNLVNEALGTLVAKNPSGTATEYWLASRLYHDYSSTLWHFDGRTINTSGSIDDDTLLYYGSGWNSLSPAYAVRPILTLKSTVKIIGGTGTSSDNYQLGL